jgi:hypothetical protein
LVTVQQQTDHQRCCSVGKVDRPGWLNDPVTDRLDQPSQGQLVVVDTAGQ